MRLPAGEPLLAVTSLPTVVEIRVIELRSLAVTLWEMLPPVTVITAFFVADCPPVAITLADDLAFVDGGRREHRTRLNAYTCR
jgi:hypothetical protein